MEATKRNPKLSKEALQMLFRYFGEDLNEVDFFWKLIKLGQNVSLIIWANINWVSNACNLYLSGDFDPILHLFT